MNDTETSMKCPICDGRPREAFPLRDGRREMRCRDCGAFFYWPLPTEAEQKAFYDGSSR